MKPAPLILASATFVVSGSALLIGGHIDSDPPVKVGPNPSHQALPDDLSLAVQGSDRTEVPVISTLPSMLQALDQSVLAVMNDKTMSNEKKFTFFWDGYQRNKSTADLATYYIDCLSSIVPLPHVEQLLTELASPMTAAGVKTHLMQVLQTGYLRENGIDEKNRTLALDAIRSNVHNVDPAVAGQAVLLYARMGAPDDLVAILDDARQRKIISPLDYLREGVFQLPNIAGEKQQNGLLMTLINTAQGNGTDESVHMLTTTLGLIIQSPTRLARIESSNRNQITEFLASHEPEVKSDGINYDLVSAIEYADWLYSYASVKSKSDTEALVWITGQVTDASADFKKIVAVMTGPMAPEVARMARQNGLVDGMRQKVQQEMAGQRPGTAAYSAYEAALEILK